MLVIYLKQGEKLKLGNDTLTLLEAATGHIVVHFCGSYYKLNMNKRYNLGESIIYYSKKKGRGANLAINSPNKIERLPCPGKAQKRTG